MPDVWIDCATCEGSGGWPESGDWRQCPDCEGEEGHIEREAAFNPQAATAK